MLVGFNAAAKGELTDAIAYYNQQVEGLGDAFATEVRATLLRVIAIMHHSREPTYWEDRV